MLVDKIRAVVPGITDADLMDKVILQDDGQGPYIAKWDIDRPRPTEKELADAKPKAKAADPIAELARFLRANPAVLAALNDMVQR